MAQQKSKNTKNDTLLSSGTQTIPYAGTSKTATTEITAQEEGVFSAATAHKALNAHLHTETISFKDSPEGLVIEYTDTLQNTVEIDGRTGRPYLNGFVSDLNKHERYLIAKDGSITTEVWDHRTGEMESRSYDCLSSGLPVMLGELHALSQTPHEPFSNNKLINILANIGKSVDLDPLLVAMESKGGGDFNARALASHLKEAKKQNGDSTPKRTAAPPRRKVVPAGGDARP
ncbi:MAG: hypothetical protein AB7G06_09015 [Bdellovibrionales bacterium]